MQLVSDDKIAEAKAELAAKAQSDADAEWEAERARKGDDKRAAIDAQVAEARAAAEEAAAQAEVRHMQGAYSRMHEGMHDEQPWLMMRGDAWGVCKRRCHVVFMFCWPSLACANVMSLYVRQSGPTSITLTAHFITMQYGRVSRCFTQR